MKKKVAFVDKPLPLPHPTKADFSRICHKLLVRTNLCEFEAFKYPNLDVPAEETECSQNSEETIEQKGKSVILSHVSLSKNRNLGRKIHHNVSYRLWRLSNKTQNQDILMKTNNEVKTVVLLVRTKLDGCEVTGKRIIYL